MCVWERKRYSTASIQSVCIINSPSNLPSVVHFTVHFHFTPWMYSSFLHPDWKIRRQQWKQEFWLSEPIYWSPHGKKIASPSWHVHHNDLTILKDLKKKKKKKTTRGRIDQQYPSATDVIATFNSILLSPSLFLPSPLLAHTLPRDCFSLHIFPWMTS